MIKFEIKCEQEDGSITSKIFEEVQRDAVAEQLDAFLRGIFIIDTDVKLQFIREELYDDEFIDEFEIR